MFELVAFVVIARMKTRNEFICSPEKPEVRRRGRWRWRGRRRHGRRQRAAETAAAAAAWCAAAALLAAGGARAERFTLGYITGSQRRENNPTYQRPGLVISGAISMAVDEVNEQLLGPMGHELGFVIAETYGQEEDSIRQVAELWAANVSGYIGPQETCVHEGRMAAAFNLPMISYYCRDVECSNKSVYPTFARTRPPDAAISHSVVAVLAHFRFMHVVFVYLANANNDFSRLAAAIMDAARAQNIAVQAVRSYRKPYYHDSYSPNPFLDIVRETYKDTRVYVSIGHYHDHIGLMLALDAQHLLDKGEYVAVGVDIEQYAAEAPHTYLTGPLRDRAPVEPRTLLAFRSYLAVAPSPAAAFPAFARRVNRRLLLPPFRNVSLAAAPSAATVSPPVAKEIPVEAAWLHDAVWTYARALAAQLRAHAADPNDGRALAARMRDTTYNSCMGYLVHMDSNGDAVGNYTLLGLDPARPPGLYPLATLAHASHTLPELKPLRDFQWVGGKPPLSEPVCGFRGEKCVNHVGEIGAGVAGGALILLVLAALALYRGWRYEQELDSLLWKIDFRDVRLARGSTRPDRDHPAQHSNNINNNSQQGSHPPVRTSQVSLSSNPDLDFRYSGVYCELVLYRGRVLALKRVHKQSVDITREMKKELKAMRDIQHDNVNAFVGACTEPPNVCVISDYCTRGSLKDILDNDDFKLDNMFVASLVGDIIRGMIFLHESPIQFHGALKPANCLVDSRWVLKLTDFGLRSFRRGELPPTDAHAVRALMDGLVYCAPEHLRAAGWGAASGARAAPAGGSPAGDVYSFALVLYELHTRQGAFGAHAPPPEDVLALVASAAPGHTPYRPPLEPLESCFEFVRECCCECWAEEASARPDFKTVRTRLRPLRKGMKPNIFDNMMAMMEKYANNLEALVDERTDLLQEEKKKTEALLVEMLPAPVAEQLKRGLRVLPESFSCVTIYFSDIVGFTAMSAESTPLQVVDFLNDLYTCFDSILESFDVYKVETIGDAYMVVSGLPLRNGWAHAGEVASMALALLSATRAFRVRHRPDHRLMLRVGLHSGPVCAGVVGLKMPRYCLFGDTVNTASRFESTGAPLKIHCSAACKRILDKLGGYHLEERGIVPMKGKRDQLTYWLKGEDATAASLRAKLRAARKANSAKGTPVLADKRDAKGPRSSLKNKNWRNQLNSLHRCCSLESPKKLRFASGSLLESHTDSVLHHRSDEYLMEVFADSRYSNKQGATHLEPPTLCYDHTSTSCPIIEHSDEHLSPPPAPPAASLSCDLLDTRYRPPSPSPSPPPTARTADIKLVINGHSFGDPHGESAVPLLADV